MNAEQKTAICKSIAVECIQDDELLHLFQTKKNIIAYDGFEPSGRMHLAQGVLKAVNVNKMTRCGITFKFWVADWFAQLNNKMNGDLEKIQLLGKYMIEIWKALGMEMQNVEFLWASSEIDKRHSEYWNMVMHIARNHSLKRVIRCSQIMGRSESDDLSASQIFYPCMQVADIFFLKADICQMGLDQRKVNMLAREYAVDNKPIILSHAMIPGLQGQEKMAKSEPSSAIFMDDTEQEVNAKIKKALCPPKQCEGNPCIVYVKQLVFPCLEKFDIIIGDTCTTYTSCEKFEEDYISGHIHPKDLKAALSAAINQMLNPVRIHFESNEEVKIIAIAVKRLLS